MPKSIYSRDMSSYMLKVHFGLYVELGLEEGKGIKNIT